jgi:TRAP transporter 4TM/12TM fusion protein
MTRFVNALAVLLSCSVLAVAGDFFRAAGLSLYTEQYLAGLLALAMPLLFLAMPAYGARKRTGPVPWYDIAAAAASFAGMAYVVVRFPALSELVADRPWDGLIVAAVIVVLVLEGLRRTVGSSLLYTTIGFFVLAMFAGALPSEFAGRSIPFGRLTYFSLWDSTAALGTPLKIVTTIVVVFVFFGQILFRSGGADFFTDVAMALMGRYRGGPAKIAILGSSLFGSISGNVVSNVLTVGVVTIPLMIRVGFRPVLAAAIEANASTGGQMMPPVMGAAAFVMAEFLQVPFSDVALAALIPAFLFYVALFVQVDLEAARSNIRPMERDQIPRLRTVLRQGWYFPIPFAVLVFALFFLHYEPEKAGLLSVAVALALAVIFPFKGKRIGLGDFAEMLRDTGLSVLDLFMLGAASGIMIGALSYSGTGFTLSIVLLHLAGGSLIALLVLAAIANIVLGLGLPTIACYIVLATLVAPTLIQMGIDPMAAHMFILYYGGSRPQQDRLARHGLRLDAVRGAVPLRLLAGAADEGAAARHRRRFHRGGRGGVVRGGRDDGLFEAAARASRTRLLCDHRRLHLPARRYVRRRALDQCRRRADGDRYFRPRATRPRERFGHSDAGAVRRRRKRAGRRHEGPRCHA